MKQEDKDLLLRDLSARLPYGVIVDIKYNKEHGSSDRLRICSEGCLTLNTDVLGLFIENEIYIKPYLRPMSSMTEKEEKEIRKINCQFKKDSLYSGVFSADDGGCTVIEMAEILNFLNAHHFDYRDLIEKGLALKAPKGMYK